MGRQGDRLLARAQKCRYAARRAHRRGAGLGRSCRRFSLAGGDAVAKLPARPLHRRAEMGGRPQLSRRRQPARRQVYRAGRRFRSRRPRHAERGPALAGAASAAPSVDARLGGGGGAAPSGRCRPMAVAGGAACRADRDRAASHCRTADRDCQVRGDARGTQFRRRQGYDRFRDLRSGRGTAQHPRHADRDRAPDPRTRRGGDRATGVTHGKRPGGAPQPGGDVSVVLRHLFAARSDAAGS